VEGEGGRLDEEGDREEQEEPPLRLLGHAAVLELGEREGDRLALRRGERAERGRSGEHQEGADERVDDELRRGLDAVVPAPAAHEEVEGHEHEVEEEDEEREVLGAEGTEHGRLREPHVEVEEPRAVPLGQGRGPQRHYPDERGEREEEQVEPVDADRVADPELLDPRDVRDVVVARLARGEVPHHRHRVGEHPQGGQQRDPLGRARRQQDGEHAGDQRHEDGNGERDVQHQLAAMRK
jgi:hypothetical protein